MHKERFLAAPGAAVPRRAARACTPSTESPRVISATLLEGGVERLAAWTDVPVNVAARVELSVISSEGVD